MQKSNKKCVLKKSVIVVVSALCILSAAAFSACDELLQNNADNSAQTDPALTIALSEYELTRGESFGLSAIASDGSAITWSSSDESVAEVSSDGVVYAKDSGTVTITAASKTAGSASCDITVHSAQTGERTLLWSDEFNGDSLDTTKWSCMTGVQDHYGNSTGPTYWGNNEEQYYTEDAATVENGSLVITATREEMPNGCGYSSARISTRDNFYTTYGYIEARIKTPSENGMWPAFWMLPQPSSSSSTQNKYGGWATNGEIDIMEAKGRLQNVVDTTLHFSQRGVHAYRGTSYTLSSDTDEWHTYAIEWTESSITWYIDDAYVYSLNNTDWNYISGDTDAAPFDQPFYILLNLAVGGTYDNYVSPDGDFVSASMYVDYVRVYSA